MNSTCLPAWVLNTWEIKLKTRQMKAYEDDISSFLPIKLTSGVWLNFAARTGFLKLTCSVIHRTTVATPPAASPSVPWDRDLLKPGCGGAAQSICLLSVVGAQGKQRKVLALYAHSLTLTSSIIQFTPVHGRREWGTLHQWTATALKEMLELRHTFPPRPLFLCYACLKIAQICGVFSLSVPEPKVVFKILLHILSYSIIIKTLWETLDRSNHLFYR